jgi:ATP-dependent DNA helicase RecQ
VDAYEIQNRNFDEGPVADKIHGLFQAKQAYEIKRIHTMLRFFQSTPCLSKNLAAYFGETIEKQTCGHCSACKTGKAVLEQTIQLQPLSEMDFNRLTREFKSESDTNFSPTNLTRFLCGIHTPAFSRTKIPGLPQFGALEAYGYKDVASWVREHLEG